MTENKTYAMPLLKRSERARINLLWGIFGAVLVATAVFTWQWTWGLWLGILFIGGILLGAAVATVVVGTTTLWLRYWVRNGEFKAWHRFSPWGDGGYL